MHYLRLLLKIRADELARQNRHPPVKKLSKRIIYRIEDLAHLLEPRFFFCSTKKKNRNKEKSEEDDENTREG